MSSVQEKTYKEGIKEDVKFYLFKLHSQKVLNVVY